MSFSHTSRTMEREPAWGEVDKSRLPRLAFAERGEPGLKSTWKYPHHWVRRPRFIGADGVYLDGELYLHRGGLAAAWAAAQGARSGERAPAGVIAHLRAHRRDLGLE
jgi:hypothetical protein